MRTLTMDNEENAAICLRVIIEIHKNYRSMPALEDQIQPFFDFVREMLITMSENLASTVDNHDEMVKLRN